MSNYSNNSNKVTYEILDNDRDIFIFCKLCQKKLTSYRIVRYHFSVIHTLSKTQFSRISKVARILE